MKKLMFTLLMLATGLLILSACASTPYVSAKPATNKEPAVIMSPSPIPSKQVNTNSISVAKAYVEAANRGDFQKALAFFSDDAVVQNGLGVFVGKQEISNWLEMDIKTTQATPKSWKINGSLVIVTGQVSLARFKQAGIDAVDFQSDYLIDNNNKILFFASAVTLTPDQQKMMQAAQTNVTPAPTPIQNPIDVVKAYVEAANSGNFANALAFYADDSAALVTNGTLLLSGKQQIADWLKTDVQTTRAFPQDWKMTGNMVINTGTVSLDRFKKLGINSVQYSAEYIVENGKIRFFRPTVMLTPEQQVIVNPSQPTHKP